MAHLISVLWSVKARCATEIAAYLAFSAIQNNDKIGVIFFSDRIEKYIAPKKGRKHILYLIREMLTFTPNSKKTDVGVSLEYLNKVMSDVALHLLLVISIRVRILVKNYE